MKVPGSGVIQQTRNYAHRKHLNLLPFLPRTLSKMTCIICNDNTTCLRFLAAFTYILCKPYRCPMYCINVHTVRSNTQYTAHATRTEIYILIEVIFYQLVVIRNFFKLFLQIAGQLGVAFPFSTAQLAFESLSINHLLLH